MSWKTPKKRKRKLIIIKKNYLNRDHGEVPFTVLVTVTSFLGVVILTLNFRQRLIGNITQVH